MPKVKSKFRYLGSSVPGDYVVAEDTEGTLDLESIQTPTLRSKTIAIGPWCLHSTSENYLGETVAVPHGLTLSQIRSVTGVIQNDAQDTLYPFAALGYSFGGDAASIGIWEIATNDVQLEVFEDKYFNRAEFSSAVLNRGWVTIMFVT